MQITTVSVKVMRSFDYCHFEVNLSASIDTQDDPIKIADMLRKDAARLADKAVGQYKVSKSNAEKLLNEKSHRLYAINEAKRIEQIAEPDRTVREQSVLKAFQDEQWEASRPYNYEDDWNEQD